MKIILLLLFIGVSFAGFAQDEVQSKFSKGLKFESSDKQFKFRVGGRIQWDNAFFFQDDTVETVYGHLNNGSEFRRARLFVSGLMYGNVTFKLQMDFAGNNSVFKDVYIELKDIPLVQNIRLGHFKEPIRLNALTSSKYITFTERTFAEGYAKDRATGIMLHREHRDGAYGWQAGLFRNSDLGGNALNANDGYSLTGRLTSLLWQDGEPSRLVHIGASYSYRATDSRTAKIEGEESHMGPDYATTGILANIDKTALIGVELAIVLGPLSFQTEGLQATLMSTLDTVVDVYLTTYYGQISYFLTGESRVYKGSFDGFGRTSPKRNFGKNGAGAWEIALRYSGTDLNHEHVFGGAQQNITAAVNWYLNPVTRFNIEYILAELDNVGNVSIIQSRLYIEF